jgi:fatty acid desaturase
LKEKYSLARTIPTALIQKYAAISSWKSPFLICIIYLSVYIISYANHSLNHWSVFIPALLITAALQHHLVTIMHEGAHRAVHPNMKVNDRWAQAMCAFQHHRHSGDVENDPEVKFYQGTGIGYGAKDNKLIRNLIGDLTGLATIRSIIVLTKYTKKVVQEGKLRKLTFWDFKWGVIGLTMIVLPPLVLGFLKSFLLLWILNMAILTPLLIRWHSIGEHTGVDADYEQDKTITHEFNILTNFFLYPIHSGWHLEHHLFAQIPWYNMKEFRRELLNREDYQAEAKKLTVKGFWWGESSVRKIVFNK